MLKNLPTFKKHNQLTMKILLIPCDLCNIKIVNAIDPYEPLEPKYKRYLKTFDEFEQMFNEGSLDLNRKYIKFVNPNQL
jgi:hypothetical protein